MVNRSVYFLLTDNYFVKKMKQKKQYLQFCQYEPKRGDQQRESEQFHTDMELLSGRTMCVGVLYSVNCDIHLLCLTLLYELMKNWQSPKYSCCY